MGVGGSGRRGRRAVRRPAFTPAQPRSPRDELRSAGAQVAVELHLAPATGEQRAWIARCLAEQLPATLAALRAGAIDYRRAAAIAEVAASHGGPIARAVEATVLPKAGQRTISQHRIAIDTALLEVAPRTAEQRHTDAAAGRRVVHYPTGDGMADTVATLTADGMATLRTALDAAADAIKTATRGETRTLDQLRADALVEMARRSLTTGWLAGDTGPSGRRLATQQGRRPHIQVTVPFSTLIGIDDHPGHLDGYGPIPASVARRIAADGVWRRLLTGPVSGRLLDYGTSTYQPPADLRDYVIARDRTCVLPGCRQPPAAARSTTPSPTRPGPPQPGTTARSPADTTSSKPTTAGSSTNPTPATSSGPVRSARPTSASPNPSAPSSTWTTPVTAPTIHDGQRGSPTVRTQVIVYLAALADAVTEGTPGRFPEGVIRSGWGQDRGNVSVRADEPGFAITEPKCRA